MINLDFGDSRVDGFTSEREWESLSPWVEANAGATLKRLWRMRLTPDIPALLIDLNMAIPVAPPWEGIFLNSLRSAIPEGATQLGIEVDDL